MSQISSYRLLSFDVYGTLIDWETGIHTALRPLLAANSATHIPRPALLRAFAEVEHAVQTESPDMVYSEVLATCHARLPAHLGLNAPQSPSRQDSKAFAASIGSWPAFPDTVDALRRLARHFKLVVLSNVDRASFARTAAGPLKDVRFDLVVTAQDVGSYKPDPRNFEYMLAAVQREFGVGKGEVLQTAQSQFHDQHPAKKLGIKGAWIARRGASIGVAVDEEVYDWKFDTMGEMADQLERELAEKE